MIHMDSHVISSSMEETEYTKIMGHMDVISIISGKSGKIWKSEKFRKVHGWLKWKEGFKKNSIEYVLKSADVRTLECSRLGVIHKPCGQPWGEGVREMSTLLIKPI